MDNLSLMTLILAIATFLLACAAFYNIWQNYRHRSEDKELNFKSKSLDEIYEWANSLYHAVVSSSSPDFNHKMEIEWRLRNALSGRLSIPKLARLFGKKKETKVNEAIKCIDKFQTTIYHTTPEEGKGFLDVHNEEHRVLVNSAITSLYELIEIVYEEKMNLFIGES